MSGNDGLQEYSFIIRMPAVDNITEEQMDLIYEAGLNYGTVSRAEGEWKVSIEVMASSLAVAITTAVDQLIASGVILSDREIVIDV